MLQHLNHGPPALRWWGRAYALATLIHLALPDFESAGWAAPQAVAALGALWLLWRPALGAWLLCLAGALWPLLGLRDVLTQSMLLAWIAAAAGVAVALDRPGRRTWQGALHAARLLVAGTYLLAALHKLNAGFFDPSMSCATHAWEVIYARWPVPLPTPVAAAMPALVVLWEVALAVGVWRRAPWVLPLGLVFHAPLTATLAPAFEFVMWVGYAAALTPRQMVRWRQVLRRHGGWLIAAAFLAAGADLVAVGALESLGLSLKLGLMGAVLVGSLLAWAPPRATTSASRPVRWLAAAWLLHGLTPYLGLQYQHTGAMLSNLRVDDPCWNSWVFPQAMRGPDPYLRIEVASIGTGQRPAREQVLVSTLWNRAALHTMHRNWCIPENRPIHLAGTLRGAPWDVPDLCAADWARHLPGGAGVAGFQRFQKNLKRDCQTPCVH
jgi:hypothetical protein